MPAKKSNKTKPNVSGRGLKAKATVPVWMVLAMVVLVVVLGVVVIYKSYAASLQSRLLCSRNLGNYDITRQDTNDCADAWENFLTWISSGRAFDSPGN